MEKDPPRSINQITIDTRGKNSRNPEPCLKYKMGRCSKGENCIYAHVEGQPCRDYRMGRCLKGQNCKFAHVEGHQSNVADNRDDDYNGKKRLALLHGGPASEEYELLDQTGVQHGANSTFRSQSATAPSHGPYRGTTNVSACEQVNPNYGTQSATVDPNGQNCIYLHAEPAPRFGKKGNWKTKICPKWQKGYCPHGSTCTYAHGENELQGQSGSQNAFISYPSTESVAAPPRGAYHVPANVSAGYQVHSNSGTQSATAPPHRPYDGRRNVSASDPVISNIGTQSATADPHGAYHGTTNVPSRDHKNATHPFNWDRKTVGIYADWLVNEKGDDKTI